LNNQCLEMLKTPPHALHLQAGLSPTRFGNK
jgi:hypothetical protein